MQQTDRASETAFRPPPAHTALPGFPPGTMALHLRRASGAAALCFAQAMHEGAAWVNEEWAAYWADVMRLV